MRIWLALLLAPVLTLTDQSVAFATVGWACARQQTMVMHAVHAGFLLAILVATFLAWQLWHETVPSEGSDETLKRRHFLAGLAMASGVLSALVTAAMWFPTWIIPACAN
jgi:hypothetical protein